MTDTSLADEDGYSVLVDDLIGKELLVSCNDSSRLRLKFKIKLVILPKKLPC